MGRRFNGEKTPQATLKMKQGLLNVTYYGTECSGGGQNSIMQSEKTLTLSIASELGHKIHL